MELCRNVLHLTLQSPTLVNMSLLTQILTPKLLLIFTCIKTRSLITHQISVITLPHRVLVIMYS